MALLSILEYPDPRLRTRASSVTRVDDRIRRLIDDMIDTMYAAPGVGLAASQVNVHKRVVVVDISEERNTPYVFINPMLELLGGEVETQEGCLSVPGFYEPVKRAERILARALDRDGVPFELAADGMLAVCVQHECDHLEGKLFVDYLSGLKRQRIRAKLQKQHRVGT
jgi:peptide deformylase